MTRVGSYCIAVMLLIDGFGGSTQLSKASNSSGEKHADGKPTRKQAFVEPSLLHNSRTKRNGTR
jgi:hypothetical protein